MVYSTVGRVGHDNMIRFVLEDLIRVGDTNPALVSPTEMQQNAAHFNAAQWAAQERHHDC